MTHTHTIYCVYYESRRPSAHAAPPGVTRTLYLARLCLCPTFLHRSMSAVHRTSKVFAGLPTGLIHAQVYESVEMRLLPILAAAQARGIPVDVPAVERQLSEIEAAAAAARRAACATACLTIDFDDVRSREAALDAVGAGAAAFRDAGGGARPPTSAQVKRCVSTC